VVKACMPKPSSIRLVVLIQYRLVTDRQTDGDITTSRRQRMPRYSIASRGKTDLTSAPNAKRGSLYREQLAFYRRQCIELQSVHDNRCSDVLHWHDSLITVNSPTEEPAQLFRPAPSHGFQSQYNAAAFPSCGSALFSRKKSKNRKYSIRQYFGSSVSVCKPSAHLTQKDAFISHLLYFVLDVQTALVPSTTARVGYLCGLPASVVFLFYTF